MISNREKMGVRHMPFAFTQEGVAMLSSVLRSKRTIEVNISIMRAFVKLREMFFENAMKGVLSILLTIKHIKTFRGFLDFFECKMASGH